MYRHIMVPTEKDHIIELPKELYGRKVEVIAFPLQDEEVSVEKTAIDPDKFYDGIKLNFSGFKFNRDEANER